MLQGWRPSTIDIDLKLVPDSDALLRAIQRLKEELSVNVELASPDQFIPPLPGWEDRSLFVSQHGKLAAYHLDLYSQALAKIERGHAQDRADIRAMFENGLIEPERLQDLFAEIEPELFRYPAVNPGAFREAVEELVRSSTAE